MSNLPYDRETLGRALIKVRQMAENESSMKPCARDQDVFDYHLGSHAKAVSLLEIPKSFRDFHLLPDNLAFFDLWEHVIRENSIGFANAIWEGTEIRSKSQLEQMIKGQIAVGKWQIFMFGNFIQGRGRRFRLSPSLAPVLMHTDVKVPAVELRPPSDFMAIQLPKGLLNMVEEGKEPIDCRYLLITRQQLIAGDRVSECERAEDGLEFIAVLAISKPRGDGTYGDLTLIDTMSLREGKTVDEEIRAYVERRRVHSLGSHLQVDLPEGKVRYGNPLANIFALAANIILYSTNRAADVIPHNQAAISKLLKQVNRHRKGSKKGRRARKKLHEAKKYSIYVIGGNFKPKDGRVVECTRTDRTVSVRHLVRGHWKMQTCGPKWQDRKHIFVEPYWRGPELADMVERDYLLK